MTNAASTLALAAPLAEPVRKIFQDHCVDCHNSDFKNGGVDLETLSANFDPRDVDQWVKIESAIIHGKMPPAEESPLAKATIQSFAEWFETQWVTPGGIQHAGPNRPRRLTREELQNTLEDILQVDLRATITNSRLHVIPDTVLEKFFPLGVLGESGFSNDAETLGKESIDIQTYARCFALVLSLIDSTPRAREHLFNTQELTAPPLPEARRIIARFGALAYRRKLTTAEQEAFFKVYQTMAAKRSPQEAFKSTFLAVLLSPPFLYRFETTPEKQALASDQEMAVRLSYFLWSAPPDAELRKLAEAKELQDPEVLRRQVRRMLADPKRAALAENLGGEWFGYKKLRQQSAVNKRSDKMAGFYRTQYEEALLFFDSMIRYDQPLFRLVDADWAYINRHQSNIYRMQTAAKSFPEENALPPINLHYRDRIRKVREGNYEYKHAPLGLVKLDDADRGGFVTLGPTMSVTSTENRTSPIRRGVWVMERILGRHFEVPEDVPDLEETQKKAKSQKLNLSHNEILKLHSSQKGCASCHQYIDPIGFGLEVFDQLGIYRGGVTAAPEGETLHWTPQQTPRAYADRSWEVKEPLKPGRKTRIFFQWTRGRHRLDIRNVRLESGEVKLIDKHFGFTGNARRDNIWTFSLPADAPATGWRLTAEIKGDGGSDSHGAITVAAEDAKQPGHRLPNGHSFATPGELKQRLLADYREEIVDNAIRRVLAYALGRKILPLDRPAIKEIRTTLEAQNYRMTALLEAVVLSYPFRYKEKP